MAVVPQRQPTAKPKPPSMYDVARTAGVSQTTVSLVVNDAPHANIPEATRDRIWAAVQELGWRPNALARGLSQRRSQTIGLISDEIATSPHGGKMIQGMQDAAWAKSKMLLLTNTSNDPELERAALALMLERQVDGVIYAAMFHRPVSPPPELGTVPAALVDCFASDERLPSVVPDEEQGGRAATEFLLRKGHTRVAFINFATQIPAASGRLSGYQHALAAHGIAFNPTLVRYAREPFGAEGYRSMSELLDLRDRPTAVFCFNDQTALGAYEAIKQRGLSIPGDVAVVGFDNHELIATSLRPELTTMELPHYAMGQWAVERLLAEPVDGSSEPATERHRLACPLVVRESA